MNMGMESEMVLEVMSSMEMEMENKMMTEVVVGRSMKIKIEMEMVMGIFETPKTSRQLRFA